MAQTVADLQQLKGVGAILAKRLIDAGYDTFQKIAEGGEEELKKIPGISPRAIGSIVEQAKQLAEAPPHGHPEREEAVKKQIAEVRGKVEAVAQAARDRFQDKLGGRTGKKLSSDLIRIEDALTHFGGGGKKRTKRAEKALKKAEKRFAGLENAGLKKIRKGIKRARRVMQKGL